MNSLFDMDKPIFRFLSRVFDVMYLNLLFLLCSIPIVTIGASAAALYYCTLKICKDRDSSITNMFFYSLKSNLKQGIIMTNGFLGFLVFLLIDIYACDVGGIVYVRYIKDLLHIVLVVFAAIVSYAFPLLAQYNNTIWNILKNALLIAVLNFGYTCLIVCFNAIPIVLLLYLPELFLLTLPIWITFGFSVTAMINSKMFVKIFDKNMAEN